MKCKYCDAELVDGKPFCPSCGKDNGAPETAEEAAASVETPVEETPVEEPSAEEAAEQTPVQESAPEENAAQPVEMKEGIKLTPGKLAIAIVAGVVVLAILVALVVSGMDGRTNEPLSATELPTEMAAVEETMAEETVPATIPADGNPDDVTCKGTYTVTDDEVIAAADTVVATMGDAELTNSELQVFYWMEVDAFLSNYGEEYAKYFGLDYAQPLDTQLCQDGSDNPLTWQQYFLQCALDSWRSYQSLANEAAENGVAISEEYVQYLETVPEQLETNAASAGMASGLELVQANVGAGADVEDYIRYIELYYTGYSYFNDLYQEILPTADEIEAYFAENEAVYAESGVTRDGGKYVDVRHVLLMPQDENATTGDDGYPVYSDEAWEACRVKAQELYDQWMAGDMSEESFAQLAVDYSEDGSASSGGLYTDVTVGYMVENFNDWCFDEARQVGDHGLIQTQYGYHIMYFVGSTDIWYATAESDLINERASAILPACIERHPATIDYSAIKLGLVSLVE